MKGPLLVDCMLVNQRSKEKQRMSVRKFIKSDRVPSTLYRCTLGEKVWSLLDTKAWLVGNPHHDSPE